jgi:hypothetical protein
MFKISELWYMLVIKAILVVWDSFRPKSAKSAFNKTENPSSPYPRALY